MATFTGIPQRTEIIRTTMSHAFGVTRGVAQEFPEYCRDELLAAGVIPVELSAAVEEPVEEELTPEARRAALEEVIREVLAYDDRQYITAFGLPKVAVVTERVGFKTSSAEIEEIVRSFSTPKAEEPAAE